MQYLKTHVEGEAANVIAGLQITADNFRPAYNLLKERYGDDQGIIAALHRSIFNSKVPGNSLSELRSFYDTIECSFRSLEARKVEVDGNFSFCVAIQDKLPHSVKLELEKMKDRTQVWSTAALRNLLKIYIAQLDAAGSEKPVEKEKVEYSQKRFEHKSPYAYGGGNYKPKSSSSQALLGASGSKSQTRSGGKSCLFCQDEQHSSTRCTN